MRVEPNRAQQSYDLKVLELEENFAAAIQPLIKPTLRLPALPDEFASVALRRSFLQH